MATVPVKPEGLKELELTPEPLNVPPVVPVIRVFKLMADDAAQTGFGGVHAGFTLATFTVI
jgi:hypothetical protein